MREILFRGKTVHGKWVYGSLISAGSYCCILESEEDVHPMDYPYLDDELGVIDGKATPVDPETVGQFTGVFDKDSNKIFEGDIVNEFYGPIDAERQYEVRFAPDRGGWYPFASGDGCGCCEHNTFTPDDKGIVKEVKITDNIHD